MHSGRGWEGKSRMGMVDKYTLGTHTSVKPTFLDQKKKIWKAIKCKVVPLIELIHKIHK